MFELLLKEASNWIGTIVVVLIGAVILLLLGDSKKTEIILGFVILLPPWLMFAYGFLSALFDWRYFKVPEYRNALVLIVAGCVITSSILMIFGWRKEIIYLAAISSGIGVAMFMIEKLFSIGKSE